MTPLATINVPEQDREYAIEQVAQFIRKALPGKRLRVTVEPLQRKRSDQQNKYLWGLVYPTILRDGGEALRGWTADDLHEFFLGEHFGWEVLEGFGAKRKRPKQRSSNLSVGDFVAFVDHIQQFCAERLGIYIPDAREHVPAAYEQKS